ncbi:MAG: type II toxin-antitoxin system YafQ family toxin [Verrucomicrobiota bacterium]|nr:type II toxin-antitoxin system YafQ family toxin [Verrucomicrobiota bacterium]
MRLSQTNQFKKDIKRVLKRGKDLTKLKAVIDLFLAGDPLPPRNRHHQLSGNWAGHRDCHIEPDWILIYKIFDDELRLERTGTHSDLF